MNPEMRAGLQDALAQAVAWISLDYDAAETLHQQAVDENRTWPTTQALLYLLDQSLRRPDLTTEDIVQALRTDIANLAAQEDAGQEGDQE